MMHGAGFLAEALGGVNTINPICAAVDGVKVTSMFFPLAALLASIACDSCVKLIV